MAITDYSIDTSGSPQDVQRRQKLADTLMAQGMDSSAAAGGKNGGWLTALNRGLAGALGGYQAGQARSEEAAGRQGYQQQLAQALSGGKIDPTAMVTLSGNPWANGTQIGAIGKVLDSQHTTERDAVADKHWGATYQLQKDAAGRAAQSAERANMTPAETAKEREEAALGYGLDPKTPQGRAYALTGKMPEADTTVSQAVAQRKTEAASLGLDPTSPGYQSYVLTGKMPREDAQPLTATDKKAVLEADEKVQAGRQTIENLNKAKVLSKQSFEGPYASKRGYLASFLGESSDTGKRGIATQDLDNLVTSNALTQLKSIFGGNPTEGERAILLDIQGSASKPHDVRVKIFDRAIDAANKRMTFEQQRADELRGGSFYKANGGTSKKTDPAAAPDPAATVIDGYTIKAR